MLTSYFQRIYDNFKPSAEQGLINLGEKIETNASQSWNNLSELTHESLKSADGYIRKYQQQIKDIHNDASKDDLKKLIARL